MSQVVNYYYRRGVRPSLYARADEQSLVELIKHMPMHEASATIASLLVDARNNLVRSTVRVSPNIYSALEETSEKYNIGASYILGAALMYYGAPNAVPDYAFTVSNNYASVSLWVSDGSLFVYAKYTINTQNTQEPASVIHTFFWHEVDDEVRRRLGYSVIHTLSYIAESMSHNLSKLGVHNVLINHAKTAITSTVMWLKHYKLVRDVQIGDHIFDMVNLDGKTYLYRGLRLEPMEPIDEKFEWYLSRVYSVLGLSVLHKREAAPLIFTHPEAILSALSRDGWHAVVPLREGEDAMLLADDNVCISASGAWVTRASADCALEVRCTEPYIAVKRQVDVTSSMVDSALAWLIIRSRLGLCNPDIKMAVRLLSQLNGGGSAKVVANLLH